MNKVPQILLAFDWYDHRIHQGIINFAKEKKWNIFCLNKVSDNTLNPVTEKFHPGSWKFDGAISLIDSSQTAEYFKGNKIPVVNLGAQDFDLKIPRLITDNEAVGEIAAEHFLERGFSNFYVPLHWNVIMFRERYESFKKHLQRNGAECQFITSKNILNQTHKKDEILFFDYPVLWWKKRLKQLDFPIALFAYEDSLAAEWLMFANRIGLKVPDQFAILGVDNNPLIVEAFDTSLSSIETDQEGLGYASAQLLSDILDGKEKMKKNTFLHDPISVVTRRSTDTIASKNPMVNKALKIIHEDLSINASVLANRMGITQQGLQYAFRNHFHFSPAQTIRSLRMREIKHLLSDKQIPMKTIAKTTGFSSEISFSQTFKKETGMTPGEYRKNHK